MTDDQREQAFQAYVECAMWSSTEDDGTPLDENYGPDDISLESLDSMRMDILDFIDGAGALVDGMDPAQVGHDFWLTRNRHGAGFWDRGLGDVGDKLTAMSHPYGELDLYVGDDGFVYVNPV